MSNKDFAADFLAQQPREWWGSNSNFDRLETELNLIENPKIRAFTMFILSKAELFWTAPISTGEFDHFPDDEYEDGGMVLHASRSIRAFLLLEPTLECTNEERDCAIAALLLRNVTRAIPLDKKGKNYTFDPMHLYTVDSFVDAVVANTQLDGEDMGTVLGVDDEHIRSILRLIRTSGGSPPLIPETFPTTLLEKAVHFADLIATAVLTHLYENDR